MPLIERIRTSQVVVGSIVHEPGEAAVATEWWQRGCLAFTDFGRWQVRSRRGGGAVTPGQVLVGAARAEHECRHPDGLDDRMLCVIYLGDPDPGPALLVRQSTALRRARRSLVAALRLPDPDRDEVDALCLGKLELCRDAPGPPGRPGPKSRRLVARLRAEAAAHYTEPEFSLVGHGCIVRGCTVRRGVEPHTLPAAYTRLAEYAVGRRLCARLASPGYLLTLLVTRVGLCPGPQLLEPLARIAPHGERLGYLHGTPPVRHRLSVCSRRGLSAHRCRLGAASARRALLAG